MGVFGSLQTYGDNQRLTLMIIMLSLVGAAGRAGLLLGLLLPVRRQSAKDGGEQGGRPSGWFQVALAAVWEARLRPVWEQFGKPMVMLGVIASNIAFMASSIAEGPPAGVEYDSPVWEAQNAAFYDGVMVMPALLFCGFMYVLMIERWVVPSEPQMDSPRTFRCF